MEQIRLIKNNDNLKLSDLEWVEKLYALLKEDLKLSPKKAFNVIYLLQEHVPLIPDQIEQCFMCKDIYDSWRSGYYSELMGGRHYCNACIDYAPRKIRKDVGFL